MQKQQTADREKNKREVPKSRDNTNKTTIRNQKSTLGANTKSGNKQKEDTSKRCGNKGEDVANWGEKIKLNLQMILLKLRLKFIFHIIIVSVFVIVWCVTGREIYEVYLHYSNVNYNGIMVATMSLFFYNLISKIYRKTNLNDISNFSLPKLILFLFVLYFCFFIAFQNSLSCHPFLRQNSIKKLSGTCPQIEDYIRYIVQFFSIIYVYLTVLVGRGLYQIFQKKKSDSSIKIVGSNFFLLWSAAIILPLILYNPKIFYIFFFN